ncbi:hypothetical protein EW146_g1249 [Bondarzewia mesenterica]|uniref:Uncharacterized protein n=1 Tax=Bondarzewia mesenterica TaxID=1095465 RepID=A0A4S4M4Z5_9AGAM|nr:hypothetical protein EW146_g1249 [Bondarzewia mesenterica]
MSTAALILLLLSSTTASATVNQYRGHPPTPLSGRDSRNVPSQGYYDPRNNGGSFLTTVQGTFPAGLQEPINAILLGTSDSSVLVDQQTDGGLRNYFQSFGFASECLGQHSGGDQGANLGDGDGLRNETAVIRWDYGNPTFGTCQETIEGGNHFRYWVQDGKEANSGAIFMAVSYELPDKLQHDIIFNGYNLARDWLVGNVTAQSSIIPTPNLTNQSSYSGQTSSNGYIYQTRVQYVSGLLQNTSDGINHYLTVGANGTNAVDGLVALLEVQLLSKPAASSASRNSPMPWLLSPIPLLFGALLITFSFAPSLL